MGKRPSEWTPLEREKKSSDRHFEMDVDDLEEPESDAEEHGTKRPHREPKGSFSKMRPQFGNRGAEPEVNASESSGFLSARWGERGGGGGEEDIHNNMLNSCCTAESSTEPSSWSSTLTAHPRSALCVSQARSTLEDSVCPDEQISTAACSVPTHVTTPVTPPTHRACLLKSGEVNPAVCGPMPDSCSPSGSMCSAAGSAWDTIRSSSESPGCSDSDPVSAAAHLHLLGESLSLIGHHLQETDKRVCVSRSLSLLLDSLLCSLAPLICLTAQIPELRSCTQHTQASTLENISYVMPGL